MSMNLLQVPTPWVEDRQNERPLVLVVDDHPAIQDMLSWGLGFYGYRSAGATNGLEALNWLEKALYRGQFPQAILLDLLMPVMDGRMFLKRLHQQWNASVPIPPVILLTVDTRGHTSLPCSYVLTKPFHLRDLSVCLEAVIEGTKVGGKVG